MATCAGSPQIAVRARGSSKCPKHIGKEVVLNCKICDHFVCADCVIQECQKHVFERISNVVPGSKQKLQDFITQAEQTEIPSIQGKLQEADSDLAKNKNRFKNEIRKIRKQNVTVKKALDNITETFVKTYKGFEQQNTDELLNYKRDLQTRIDKLSSQIQDVKGALQSGNDILVFDMSRVIQSYKIHNFLKPIFITQEFTPGFFSVQVLEKLLGKLNTIVHPQSLYKHGGFFPKSEFTPFQKPVTSVHAEAAYDQIWMSSLGETEILLTDWLGEVKQTLDMNVSVQDFCRSPLTGNIWFCSQQDNSVREVTKGQEIVKFTTDTPPRCICVDKYNNVVIGFCGQVRMYTQGGNVICRTSGGTSPTVRTPLHIPKCPLTLHLAVVDDNNKKNGGNDKPYVSILDEQLQPLYIYTGEGQGQESPTKPFNPADVFFTGIGELVITDWNNRSVVLVTGTGRYLTTLYTDTESSPYAVCVQNNAIWVSFGDKSVKVLKENPFTSILSKIARELLRFTLRHFFT